MKWQLGICSFCYPNGALLYNLEGGPLGNKDLAVTFSNK